MVWLFHYLHFTDPHSLNHYLLRLSCHYLLILIVAVNLLLFSKQIHYSTKINQRIFHQKIWSKHYLVFHSIASISQLFIARKNNNLNLNLGHLLFHLSKSSWKDESGFNLNFISLMTLEEEMDLNLFLQINLLDK